MNIDDGFVFDSAPEKLIDNAPLKSRVSEFSRMVTETDESVVMIDTFRKPRPCLSQLGPLATWVFLGFANFSFVMIEVLPWIGKFEVTTDPRAIWSPLWVWLNLAVFELFFVLALWAHLRTYFSDPGFIPRGYNYNIKKMTPANVSLFNYISLAKEKTDAIKTAQLTISRSGPVAKSSRLQQKAPLQESDKKFAVVIPTDKRLSIRQ